ncbi:hypothetical protein [Nocardioides sp. T2.26MG-1]|uniref:hypothetical protein n=1 Tax=Nocardioides sp. T2.26MG-1 TaxID=3041166 RepID=UPI0024779857|nr:hypothetical protein [Nocardioides sp. T2.26MG-1]CAI9417166.1 hypothetical protein HIDPHFAB_02952 [Nocardioides sp. T2.26MG-1]
MPETSTTTYAPQVTGAVVAHGLMALGLHMAERGLPPYIELETPTTVRRTDRMVIQLNAHTIDPWMASIEVADVTIDPRPAGLTMDTFHVLGRLPDSGVRVDLVYLAGRVLSAVSS